MSLDQIFLTEKLITANLLHIPIHVVNKNMGFCGTALLASRQNSGGEYRRHSPRRCRKIPTRAVDEDHIPIDLVEMVGEVVDAEFAVGEEKVLDGSALVPELLPRRPNQFRHFADFCGVLNIVRLDIRMFLFDLRYVEFALVEEDGPAVAVQSFPEKGLVGQPEYQEVAGRRAAA